MELLGLLGVLAFAATSLVVGVRLAWLSRRTGGYPELAIGASFVLAGFAGLGLLLAAQHGGFAPRTAMGLRLAGAAVADVGYALLASFVWRVFRPDGRAGRLGFAVSVAGLAVGFVLEVAAASPTPTREAGAGTWLTLFTQIALYGWATSEALHYWWLMRRRVRLGLAEPTVANRFLLWGVGTGAVIGIWLHTGWTLLHGESALGGASYLVIATLGFTCAIACWMAFLPPRAYVRWLERRAARA